MTPPDGSRYELPNAPTVRADIAVNAVVHRPDSAYSYGGDEDGMEGGKGVVIVELYG